MEGCVDLKTDFIFFLQKASEKNKKKLLPKKHGKERGLFIETAYQILREIEGIGEAVAVEKRHHFEDETGVAPGWIGEDTRVSFFLEDTKKKIVSVMERVGELGRVSRERKGFLEKIGLNAGGGTQRKHTEAVLWSLDTRLKQVSEKSVDLEELGRRKSKTVFGDETTDEASSDGWEIAEGGLCEDGFREYTAREINEETLMVLEEEHKALFSEFGTVNEKLLSTQRRIGEISELQTMIQTHIMQQESQLQRLCDETTGFSEDVLKGNRHLQRGSTGVSLLVRAAVFLVLSLAAVLLLLHFAGK
ncbi:MAG: SNARE protein Syntaxin 18/UFE1 [Amphiamblys sp. WSBS2006]|nr:MAG: SNARE protein Syntaxin 18/UFE1 [Amphiamblys sp. WSBS2006]